MLNSLRLEIDEIDERLIHLLAKRNNIVKSIGEYKKKNNIAPLDPQRWAHVVKSRAIIAKEHGLDKGFVEKIWDVIHKEALKIQK